MSLTTLSKERISFKRAVIWSITAHVALLLFILLSPYIPKPSRKGMVHYVNVISFPGGGGGGGAPAVTEVMADTEIPERESLRDLTTPQKLKQEAPATLRHPVEKPKREDKPPPKKKAAIRKQQRKSPTSTQKKGEATAQGSGAGTGVRFGFGSGPGEGPGSGSYSSQIGMSNFPFTYYLQIIIDRVSSNWFTSLVDPGLKGSFQTTVFFKILRTGRISGLKIEVSSGVRSLDLSALRAIQTAEPFPILPREYEGDYLGIHLIFEHSK
jgi:TonB family protein